MTLVRGLIFLSVLIMAYFSTNEVEASELSKHLDLQKIYQMLPQKTDFARLSDEEAHHSPKILKQGASLLGQVAQELSDKPYRLSEGMKFYQLCTLEKRFPKSFRAVCYKHAQEISSNLHKKTWTPKSLDPGVHLIRTKI
jgi:hypothetical protein